MTRILVSVAVVVGLSAAPAYGQLILAGPGQVVAGKTLLSASQPDLSDDDKTLIFVGEFDASPDGGSVDLRRGVFTINLATKAEKLLAWTGETELDGSPITDLSSPQVNRFGEVLFRVAKPGVSALMNETGAIVAQQGKEVVPGVVLGDVKSFALSVRSEKLVIDDAGMYSLMSSTMISKLPLQVEGANIAQPAHLDLNGFDNMTLANEGSLYRWFVPNNFGVLELAPGDAIGGHEISQGLSMAIRSQQGSAIVAALANGKTALFEDNVLLLQEDDLLFGKKLGAIAPEITLTDANKLVFSAVLDGEQTVFLIPEPAAIIPALMALAFVVTQFVRRSRR
jgi:hypothetical protein